MNPPDPSASRPVSPPTEDSSPGVPGFATWRIVYMTVMSIFVLTVAALRALPYLAR